MYRWNVYSQWLNVVEPIKNATRVRPLFTKGFRISMCHLQIGFTKQYGVRSVTSDFLPRPIRSTYASLAACRCFASKADDDDLDCYAALGIDKTATQEQVKSAYYELSKLYHPDTGKELTDATARRFNEITEAYEILGNPHLRKKYDDGVLHTVSHLAERQDTYKKHPIEHEEFYRSRLAKTKTRAGKRSIYNIDDWTRSHISSTFEHQQQKKHKRATMKVPPGPPAPEHDEILKFWFFGLLSTSVLLYYFIKSTHDSTKKPDK